MNSFFNESIPCAGSRAHHSPLGRKMISEMSITYALSHVFSRVRRTPATLTLAQIQFNRAQIVAFHRLSHRAEKKSQRRTDEPVGWLKPNYGRYLAKQTDEPPAAGSSPKLFSPSLLLLLLLVLLLRLLHPPSHALHCESLSVVGWGGVWWINETRDKLEDTINICLASWLNS